MLRRHSQSLDRADWLALLLCLLGGCGLSCWPSGCPCSPRRRMEGEHLGSAAGEPYRDPTGIAPATVILAKRQEAQAASLASGARSSSGACSRRWLLELGPRA
jgi:hypothetical protein